MIWQIMIPSLFPRPLLIVYVTGILELLGAVGLLLPRFKSLAGICLILLLLGMFVANVNAAQKNIMLRDKPVPPHSGFGLRCSFFSSDFSGGQLVHNATKSHEAFDFELRA
jgi:uncharacterized membrane protein